MTAKLDNNSKYTRYILALMTGTIISQVITIAVSPLITRLFTPENFGILALFSSFIGITGGIVAGRYDVAILHPNNDSHAFGLFKIAMMLSVISCMLVLMLGLGVLSTNLKFEILQYNEKYFFLFMFSLGVLFTGIIGTFNYWLNRKSKYSVLSTGKVVLAVVVSIFQLIFGVLGYSGIALISSILIGQFFLIVFLWLYIRKTLIKHIRGVHRLRILSKKYSDYPKKSAIATLCNSLSYQAEVLILVSYFGLVVGGFLAIANRVVNLPKTLLAASIWQVFMGQKKEYNNKSEIFSRVKYGQEQLLKLVTLPFMSVILISPDMFSIVFGAEWRQAGVFASIMLVGVHISLIVSSYSLFIIINRLDAELKFNLMLLASKILALLFGILVYDDVIMTISLLTTVQFLLFFILGGWNYRKMGQTAISFARLYLLATLKYFPFFLVIVLLYFFFIEQVEINLLILMIVNILWVYYQLKKTTNENPMYS